MNTTFLRNSSDLCVAFKTALGKARCVDVAVAYATKCDQLEMLCKHARDGKELRAIVGQDDYVTDPSAVRALYTAAKNGIRWGLAPPRPGIFHPKLFYFHSRMRDTALVGSANLTGGGFRNNVEATVCLSGDRKQLKRLVQFFETQWEQARGVNEQNLAEYEADRLAHQRFDGTQPPPPGPVTAPVLSWRWDEYVHQLRLADRLWRPFRPARGWGGNGEDSYLISRLNMLRQLAPLARQPLQELSLAQRQALFSDESDQFPGASWLGNLRAAAEARRLLTQEDDDCRVVQAAFTVSLRSIPDGLNPHALAAIGAEFDTLDDIYRVGSAVVTRYFTLRRPNACISVNSASATCLRQILGVGPLSRGSDYVVWLEKLWQAPWMNAPEPADCLERWIWDNRADCLTRWHTGQRGAISHKCPGVRQLFGCGP